MSLALSPAYLDTRARRLQELRAERREVRRYLQDADPREAEFLDAVGAVRRAAFVLGSPRGGTSAFTAVLARGDNVLALPGEYRHLFTLAGGNFPDHGGSGECADTIDASQAEFVRLELGADTAGTPLAVPDALDTERYALEWALRFRLQWPELDVSLDTITSVVHDGVRALRSPDGEVPTADFLVAEFLRRLLDLGVPIDPSLYALAPDVLAAAFGDYPLPGIPPASTIVEISPYLVVGPTRRPLVSQDATFVLKASSDAFRLPVLARTFPDWDLRFVHLTRNPLAAVNGLIDGWGHHCFWQHDLGPVDLPPHDDPVRQGSWWKFDLFDGWREAYDSRLPELCAMQWLSSHRRIVAWFGAAIPRLAFEGFHRPEERAALVATSAEHLGVRVGANLHQAAARPRVVNSTTTPEPGRWRRRPEVMAALDVVGVQEMAAVLGYSSDRGSWT